MPRYKKALYVIASIVLYGIYISNVDHRNKKSHSFTFIIFYVIFFLRNVFYIEILRRENNIFFFATFVRQDAGIAVENLTAFPPLVLTKVCHFLHDSKVI